LSDECSRKEYRVERFGFGLGSPEEFDAPRHEDDNEQPEGCRSIDHGMNLAQLLRRRAVAGSLDIGIPEQCV
jgi:hypothetical protein